MNLKNRQHTLMNKGIQNLHLFHQRQDTGRNCHKAHTLNLCRYFIDRCNKANCQKQGLDVHSQYQIEQLFN